VRTLSVRQTAVQVSVIVYAGERNLVASRAVVTAVHRHRTAHLPAVVARRHNSSSPSVSGLRGVQRAAGVGRP